MVANEMRGSSRGHRSVALLRAPHFRPPGPRILASGTPRTPPVSPQLCRPLKRPALLSTGPRPPLRPAAEPEAQRNEAKPERLHASGPSGSVPPSGSPEAGAPVRRAPTCRSTAAAMIRAWAGNCAPGARPGERHSGPALPRPLPQMAALCGPRFCQAFLSYGTPGTQALLQRT
ncbi:uncharacterized protein LOC107401814 isoform X3 [Peromyscus maniculatus bairdii]|uniref:uncharacterized protein LOC107401814 isoform X3 n=1 Tax=Peromyscus maniculatus bairdii TaxID=230844 RepID=UPI001C2EF2EB|nr:translation initiation factor IF-2-like isoform X3 [Peromyscus maniculatus bairdii]XP_042132351.1 translation initiation factor IF-2-like isoform X3 [Peromyscus maniculatus bairdii]